MLLSATDAQEKTQKKIFIDNPFLLSPTILPTYTERKWFSQSGFWLLTTSEWLFIVDAVIFGERDHNCEAHIGCNDGPPEEDCELGERLGARACPCLPPDTRWGSKDVKWNVFLWNSWIHGIKSRNERNFEEPRHILIPWVAQIMIQSVLVAVLA